MIFSREGPRQLEIESRYAGMENDDQLIAQTRHLAVTGVVSDPPASGSPAAAAASVPASMGAATAAGCGDSEELHGSAATAAAVGYDRNRPGDATRNAEGHHGLGGEDRGVRLGRSTAVAALGTAAGARPVEEELEDCLVGEAGAKSLSSSVVWSPRAPAAAAAAAAAAVAAPLERLPVEVLFHIMGFLDVNDLLSASRVRNPLPCCLDLGLRECESLTAIICSIEIDQPLPPQHFAHAAPPRLPSAAHAYHPAAPSLVALAPVSRRPHRPLHLPDADHRCVAAAG